jgi:hypothetical protein
VEEPEVNPVPIPQIVNWSLLYDYLNNVSPYHVYCA